MKFRINHADSQSAARAGTLSLAHGDVDTPTFMPVGTAAAVKAMSHQQLEDLGYRLILGNTYHLSLRPGLAIVKTAGGLHEFSGWPHNILTDSGGYQVFSLAQLRKLSEKGVQFQSHLDGSHHTFTPESVVDAQVSLNSDIQMALDVCTGFDVPEREAADALRLTTMWATRAKSQWVRAVDEGYTGVLFPIVQGNFYSTLRSQSAAAIAELDLPGVAIGGLSVGEPVEVFRDILAHTARDLRPDVPHYLMGIGTPDLIFDAVTAGIDMFDCVFPTRIARNGTVLTPDGRVVLRHEAHASQHTPIDENCGCRVCSRYSRAYLRHLFKAGEMLGPMLATEHNLYYLSTLLADIRHAISAGTFTAFRSGTLSRFTDGEIARRERRK